MNLLKTYRVKDWWYYLGFILLGFAVIRSFDLRSLIKYSILGSFLLAYTFSLNDFFDKHLKRKHFLIPLFLSFLLLLLFGVFQIFLSIIFLFIFTFYSAKPWRLKAKPFISSLSNGVGFSLLFLLPFSHLNLMNILLFSFFFCLNMVAQLIHEVVDLDEDKKEGIITTAVYLGEQNIRKLSCIFLILSLLFSFLLYYGDFVDLIFVVITLLFVVFFISRILIHGITKKLREEYKCLGIITGLVFFLIFINV